MKLGVNIDHVATLRQARRVAWPSPLRAMETAVAAGADQITIHLREDRRHIVDEDVEQICSACSIPVNLEMANTEEMIAVALKHNPHTVTLVPEKREEVTTEGGLDVVGQAHRLRDCVHRLKAAGIIVSLFVDPDEAQIEAAHKIGANAVELHTGEFAHAVADGQDYHGELRQLQDSALFAQSLDLYVAAGHGLTQASTKLIATVPEIKELNIGHALVGDAVFVGLAEAVRLYRKLSQAVA
jgi:pyridoxine 5-phosphate synthase